MSNTNNTPSFPIVTNCRVEARRRAAYLAAIVRCDLCNRVSKTQWCRSCGDREYSRMERAEARMGR